jgi:hypothetical protein
MSVTTRSLRKKAPWFGMLAFVLGVAACHGEAPPEAPTASVPEVSPQGAPAPADYRCTVVLGLAVTSEWYRAGFEALVDDDRWEAITKPHTFVEHWADPEHAVWKELPQSPCREASADPDRVLFFAANFTFTTRAEWDQAIEGAVETLQKKYPHARRIELLSMVRAPGNTSCGSEKGIVNPIIDESILATSRRHPGLVAAGPRFEATSCADLEKGGPHFSEAGRMVVAKLIADHYRADAKR